MVREYNTYRIRDLNRYGQRTRRSAWRWICRACRCCSGCAAGFECVPPSLGRPAPSTERAFLRSLRSDPKSKILDSNEAQTSDESPPMWAQCHTPRGPRFAPKPERAVAVRALDLRQWSRRRSAAWALQGRCWPRLLLRVRLWPRMPFRIRLVLGEGRRIRNLMPVHKDADTSAASGSEPALHSATAHSDDDADSFGDLDLVQSTSMHEYASNGWSRSKKIQWAKLPNILNVSIAKARTVLTCIQPDASRRSFLGNARRLLNQLLDR